MASHEIKTKTVINILFLPGTKQSQDQTDSELLEFLRRANLQRYHKKFYINDIHDPQDVLSAGKDEFTEMMVLVGMASKPKDIKKLKKSLKEWKNEHGGSQIILYFKVCFEQYHVLTLGNA